MFYKKMNSKNEKTKSEKRKNEESKMNKDEKFDINTGDGKSDDEVKPGDAEKHEKEIQVLRDTLLRKVAEFENYKKRTENDLSNYFKFASENLIRNLLPVYDDMHRSIESIEKGETKDFGTLKTGFLSIFGKLDDILKKEGLKEIECLGKEFSVDECDALLQIPKADVKPHTVIEIVEKGYYLKDKILKHAKVLVSAEVPEDEKGKDENNGSKNNKA